MSSEVVFIPVVAVSIVIMLALLGYWYFCHKKEPDGSYFVGKGNFYFLLYGVTATIKMVDD